MLKFVTDVPNFLADYTDCASSNSGTAYAVKCFLQNRALLGDMILQKLHYLNLRLE